MAFMVAHPWLSAAVAVAIASAIVVGVFALDAYAVRRRRARRGGYLIGGGR